MNHFHAELLTATAILPCVAGKCGSFGVVTLASGGQQEKVRIPGNPQPSARPITFQHCKRTRGQGDRNSSARGEYREHGIKASLAAVRTGIVNDNAASTPRDGANFRAVPVLAELLSNARRAGTMDSSEAQESTRTQSLEHISCCHGITRRTPAAAWPL